MDLTNDTCTYQETNHDRRGRPRAPLKGRYLRGDEVALLEWMRSRLKLSQRQFAARIGVGQPHYSAMINRRERCGPSTDPFLGALVEVRGMSLHPLKRPVEWMLAMCPPVVKRGARNAGTRLFSSADLLATKIRAEHVQPSIDRLVLAMEVKALRRREFERTLKDAGAAFRRGSGAFGRAANIPDIGFVQWDHDYDKELAWLTLDSQPLSDGRARPWTSWWRRWAHPVTARQVARWDPAFTIWFSELTGRILVDGGTLSQVTMAPDCPRIAPFTLNYYFGTRQNVFIRAYSKYFELRDRTCNASTRNGRPRPNRLHCTCRVSDDCAACDSNHSRPYAWRVEASLRPSHFADLRTFASEQINPFESVRVVSLDQVVLPEHRLLFAGVRFQGARSTLSEIEAHWPEWVAGSWDECWAYLLDEYERRSRHAVPSPRQLFEIHRPTFQTLLNALMA